MGRKNHPIYYFKIKTDFTFSKCTEEDLHINNESVIFIIKTVFCVIHGDNYTYSSHTILDKNLKPTNLKVGTILALNSVFDEYWAKEHCATIKISIRDFQGVSKNKEFHHTNGIGMYYRDIDGQGIYSIIKCLKLMEEVNEWGSWNAYDKLQEFKTRIAVKLRHHLCTSNTFICDIAEIDNTSFHEMIRGYQANNYEKWGFTHLTRNDEYLTQIINYNKDKVDKILKSFSK